MAITNNVTLFQPQAVNPAANPNNAAAGGQLSDIELISAPTAHKTTATAQDMKDNFQDGFSRLKKLGTTLYQNLKNDTAGTLKSMFKELGSGAAIGSFVGLCLGGIKGLIGGFFLGPMASAAITTAKAYNTEMKRELLDVAEKSFTSDQLEKGVPEKETTLHYTSGQQKIDFSNLGVALKSKEANIAKAALNAKNNEAGTVDKRQFKKLDLSNNAMVTPQFIAKLIVAATPAKDGNSAIHGLKDVTIKIKGTAISDQESLKSAILGALPGEDKSVEIKATETPNIFDLKVGSNVSPVNMKLKTDEGFAPNLQQPKQTEPESAQKLETEAAAG